MTQHRIIIVLSTTSTMYNFECLRLIGMFVDYWQLSVFNLHAPTSFIFYCDLVNIGKNDTWFL